MKDDLRARIVKAYARLGGDLSDQAAVSDFLSSIEATIEAARQFTARDMPVSTQRRQVSELIRLADEVVSGAGSIALLRLRLAAYADSLPPELRYALEGQARRMAASRQHHASDEMGLLSSTLSFDEIAPELDGEPLAKAVIATLRRGLRPVPRRYRSLRKSRIVYESITPLPLPRNGRPAEPGKIWFVTCIAVDVAAAIPGARPHRWRRTDERGPFADLVTACFEAAGLGGADHALRNYLQRL